MIDVKGPETMELALPLPEQRHGSVRIEADPQPFENSFELNVQFAYKKVEAELKTAIELQGSELSGLETSDQDELLKREKSFFTKIYAAATEMAQSQDGPITLMFDLDHTLIHNKTMRPTFGLLVRELDGMIGDRLQIGILSSRHPDAETEEEAKRILAQPIAKVPGVADKINYDFVVSSGEVELNDETEQNILYGNDIEAQIEAFKDVVREEVVEAFRMGAITDSDFLDARITTLQKLVRENPGRGFIAVDDLPYPSFLKDNENIRGIWAAEDVLEEAYRLVVKLMLAKNLDIRIQKTSEKVAV